MHAQVFSSGRGSEAQQYSIRLTEDLVRRDAVPSEEVALNWIFHRCTYAQLQTCCPLKVNAVRVSGQDQPEEGELKRWLTL
jgi:hypothetical protein